MVQNVPQSKRGDFAKVDIRRFQSVLKSKSGDFAKVDIGRFRNFKGSLNRNRAISQKLKSGDFVLGGMSKKNGGNVWNVPEG
jgi:hypothetical protein